MIHNCCDYDKQNYTNTLLALGIIPLVSNPQDLVKNLSLLFDINFSLKVDYEKEIWIVYTNDTMSKDITLKVFEYIYNNKYGLWTVVVENTFDNMSFKSYCRQMNGFEDLTYI